MKGNLPYRTYSQAYSLFRSLPAAEIPAKSKEANSFPQKVLLIWTAQAFYYQLKLYAIGVVKLSAEGLDTACKSNLRGITFGIKPIWGINFLILHSLLPVDNYWQKLITLLTGQWYLVVCLLNSNRLGV